MTDLYSLNGARPAPLPFRIKLPSGFTRTDPSTFTPEEIAAAGYTGPYTEPAYDPNTQMLDWVNGDYVISELPPPIPVPDWTLFSTSLLTNQDLKTVLIEAFSIEPTSVLALPAALMTLSQNGNSTVFQGAWGEICNTGLVSDDLLIAVENLAISCHLPEEFISILTT